MLSTTAQFPSSNSELLLCANSDTAIGMLEVRGLLNIDKDNKKHFCYWKDDTTHAYNILYLHCGFSTKIPLKLKYIDENEDS